eukprot:scaffold54461_cov66-Phaeocystis_antarctica.AAC.1
MRSAQAERLTLLVADNTTGYFGVYLNWPGQLNPYQAKVSRAGKAVSLGAFATAEEAALCVARSPEGQEAAERAAAAVPPQTSEKARQQAQAEKLTLLVAENTTSGYFGVCLANPGRSKPYTAHMRRGGKTVRLGCFATAEEAALCVARSPEGQAVAAERAAAAAPLTSEEARQQAQAEGLTLLVADSKTGYFGVGVDNPGRPKPYHARTWRGGKDVSLGSFTTAEEAALCVARSPEGQAVAAKRAAAAPLTSEEARQQAQAEKLTLLVAASKTGFFGVKLAYPGHPKPHQARVTRGGNMVHLGSFATAEEAALFVARSPEGQAEAARRHSRQQARAGELTQLPCFSAALRGLKAALSRPVSRQSLGALTAGTALTAAPWAGAAREPAWAGPGATRGVATAREAAPTDASGGGRGGRSTLARPTARPAAVSRAESPAPRPGLTGTRRRGAPARTFRPGG